MKILKIRKRINRNLLTESDNSDRLIKQYLKNIDEKIVELEKKKNKIEKQINNQEHIISLPDSKRKGITTDAAEEQLEKFNTQFNQIISRINYFNSLKNDTKENILHAAIEFNIDQQNKNWIDRDNERKKLDLELKKQNAKIGAGFTTTIKDRKKYISLDQNTGLKKPNDILLSWYRDFNKGAIDKNEVEDRRAVFRLLRLMQFFYGKEKYHHIVYQLRKTLKEIKDFGYDTLDYPTGTSFDSEIDDINEKNYKATTPFLFAAYLNLPDAMEIILEIMPDTYINAQDKENGWTALFYGIQYYEDSFNKSSKKVLDIVLQQHIDPNLVDNNGRTALMYAVITHKIKAFEKIIKTCGNAIDPDIKASDNFKTIRVIKGDYSLVDIINDPNNNYSEKEKEKLLNLVNDIKDNNTGYEAAELMDFSDKFENFSSNKLELLLSVVISTLMGRIPILERIKKDLGTNTKNSTIKLASENWYSNWGRFFNIDKTNIDNISQNDILNAIKHISTYDIPSLTYVYDKPIFELINRIKNVKAKLDNSNLSEKDKENKLKPMLIKLDNLKKERITKLKQIRVLSLINQQKELAKNYFEKEGIDLTKLSSLKSLFRQFKRSDILAIAKNIIEEKNKIKTKLVSKSPFDQINI